VRTRKGGAPFAPLTAPASLPLGTQIDATHARLSITTLNRAGGVPETATVSGGVFTVRQSGALTVLTLSGPKPSCSAKAKPRARQRSLSATAQSGFAIAGRYGSATGRGATWQVTDSCTGTTTRVTHGRAAVTDTVRHKRATVTAGHAYVARRR
jgi:hypothetical protein